MKEETEMTAEEKLRREYILLLCKILKHCKIYDLESCSLTSQEKEAIEYHLKDVAAHAVCEDTSQEECVAVFKGRIARLITTRKEEWLRVNELIYRNKTIISPEEENEFHVLFKYFCEKKQKISK